MAKVFHTEMQRIDGHVGKLKLFGNTPFLEGNDGRSLVLVRKRKGTLVVEFFGM